MGGEISIAQLVDGLSVILGRPVIDKTGYIGTFDAHLVFTPEGTAPFGSGGFSTPGPPPNGVHGLPSVDDSVPSIFTSLEEKLGLKLESQKGLGIILVIDHVEKPDAN